MPASEVRTSCICRVEVVVKGVPSSVDYLMRSTSWPSSFVQLPAGLIVWLLTKAGELQTSLNLYKKVIRHLRARYLWPNTFRQKEQEIAFGVSPTTVPSNYPKPSHTTPFHQPFCPYLFSIRTTTAYGLSSCGVIGNQRNGLTRIVRRWLSKHNHP